MYTEISNKENWLVHSKVHPDVELILNKILDEWKAKKLPVKGPNKKYPAYLPGKEHALYHTSIEALEEHYLKADKASTVIASAKSLGYINYRKYQVELLETITKVYNAEILTPARAYGSTANLIKSAPTAHWYKGPYSYMGWHTNHDSGEMFRITYFTYCREKEKAFIRLRNPHTGEVITSYDNPGWNFRNFYNAHDNPTWHCIYSDTDRLSIGFNALFKDK